MLLLLHSSTLVGSLSHQRRLWVSAAGFCQAHVTFLRLLLARANAVLRMILLPKIVTTASDDKATPVSLATIERSKDNCVKPVYMGGLLPLPLNPQAS